MQSAFGLCSPESRFPLCPHKYKRGSRTCRSVLFPGRSCQSQTSDETCRPDLPDRFPFPQGRPEAGSSRHQRRIHWPFSDLKAHPVRLRPDFRPGPFLSLCRKQWFRPLPGLSDPALGGHSSPLCLPDPPRSQSSVFCLCLQDHLLWHLQDHLQNVLLCHLQLHLLNHLQNCLLWHLQDHLQLYVQISPAGPDL